MGLLEQLITALLIGGYLKNASTGIQVLVIMAELAFFGFLFWYVFKHVG